MAAFVTILLSVCRLCFYHSYPSFPLYLPFFSVYTLSLDHMVGTFMTDNHFSYTNFSTWYLTPQ